MTFLNTDLFERGLPASIEAERCILGAILLDNRCFDGAEQITYNDFALDSHRRIFGSMAMLINDGRAVDIVTLAEELNRLHSIGMVGGVAYLASLTEGLPRRISIDEYVRIVKEKAQLRALINTCSSAITQAADQVISAEEVIAETNTRLMEISGERNTETQTLAQVSTAEFARLMAQHVSEEPTGLPSGSPELDGMVSGWVEGELSVVAAKPGQGKTSLLVQTLIELGQKGIPTHVFSLEMTRGQLLRRMWAAMASVKFARLRHPQYIQKAEMRLLRDAEAEAARFPLILDDTANLTPTQLVSRARVSKRRNGTRFIGLDYLQKFHFSSKAEFRHVDVSDAAVSLANLAKQEHLAVVALSSMTEKGGKLRNAMPMLGDLRQSGDIQYEASTVVIIHREIDDDERVSPSGWFVIAKQRNGETGKVAVRYNPDRLIFEGAHGAAARAPEPARQFGLADYEEFS